MTKRSGSTWDQWIDLFRNRTPAPAEQLWDSEMINKALRMALLTGGTGILAGAGLRGAQEIGKSFEEQGVGTNIDPVTISISNPRAAKRRVKQALYDKPGDWPLAIPLWVAAGGLGTYGGYAGARAIANKLRARFQKQDEEAARQEFENALKAQYAASRDKTASEQDPTATAITDRIDRHYERFEKQAWTPSPGEMGGIGLTGVLAILALAHHNAYSRFKRSDPGAIQLKIMDRQAKLRQLNTPPPVVFKVDHGDIDQEGEKEAAAAGAVRHENHVFRNPHTFETVDGRVAPGLDTLLKGLSHHHHKQAPVEKQLVSAPTVPGAPGATISGELNAGPGGSPSAAEAPTQPV